MQWWERYLVKDKIKDNEMSYIPLTKDNIAKLKEQLPPETMQVEPKPMQKIDYLTILCLAIRDFEGFYKGSRSWNNNNPGNTKYSSFGYLPRYGEVKKDIGNFAIFETYELGWLYLKNLIIHKATKHPDWNLVSLMREYAPESDGNSPQNYASYLGKRLGVSPFTFLLKNLL